VAAEAEVAAVEAAACSRAVRTMALRLLLILVVLLIGSCTSKKSAIDEIDRRHTEDMQRMGGGISGGGSM